MVPLGTDGEDGDTGGIRAPLLRLLEGLREAIPSDKRDERLEGLHVYCDIGNMCIVILVICVL